MNNDQLNRNVGRTLITVVSYAQDFTADVFKQSLRNVMFAFANPAYISKSGKRALTDVIGSGAKLESQEVSAEIARGFDKFARQNGVQYALQATPRVEDDKRTYVMYFKSKDIDALDRAMKQYIKAKEKQQNKTSVRQKIKDNIDLIRDSRSKQRLKERDMQKGRSTA